MAIEKTNTVTGIRKRTTLAVVVALSLLLLAVLAFFVRFALTNGPSFDGALNLNVSRALAEGKGYGSYYSEFRLFPQETQTNAPFVLPAALLFAVAGIRVITCQLTNLLYLVALAVGLGLVVRRLSTLPVALLAVFVAVQFPGIVEFGTSGFGEIPALSYLLFALLALASALEHRRLAMAMLGGALLGLSFLTKTVALLWVAPTVAVFCLLEARNGRRWSLVAGVTLGFASMFLAWESYRFLALGGSAAYRAWWHVQAMDIASQSGAAGVGIGLHMLRRGLTHAQLLAQQTHVPLAVLLILWILPMPVLFFELLRAWRRRDNVFLMLLGALTCTAGVYAFWWLFLEPTRYAWLRRILNGLVLQQALAVFVGWRCIQSLKIKRQTPTENAITGKGWSIGLVLYAAVLAAVLITSTIVLERGQVLTRSPEPSPQGAREIAFAEAVQKLPAEATLFGVGWWQAPVVALYSGRHMENLESWASRDLTAIKEKYLVLDSYALALDPQTVARLQATYELDPIVVSNAGTVSRIRRERSLIARTENETSGIRSMIALDREDYPHQTGVFDREGSRRWASPRVRVLLWRTTQQRVAAEVTLPPGLMGFSSDAQNHEPVVLTLSVEGCAQVTQTIPDPDRRRIEAPLTCAPAPQGAPLEVVLTLNTQLNPHAIVPDVRPLAFMIHSVELLGSADRNAGEVPGP